MLLTEYKNMQIVKGVFTMSKDGMAENNQDAAKCGLFHWVIADGVTQSFRSDILSSALVERISEHLITGTSPISAIREGLSDYEKQKNNIIKDYKKGNTLAIPYNELYYLLKGKTAASTFMAINVHPDFHLLEIWNVGDCNIFVYNRKFELIHSYPMNTIMDKDLPLELISVHSNHTVNIDWKILTLPKECIIISATDALSRYLLGLHEKNIKEEISVFLAIETQIQFEQWVGDRWGNPNEIPLEEDDITYIKWQNFKSN